MFRVILIATDGTEAGDAAVAFARNLAVSREQAVMFKRPYTEGPGGGTSRDRLCLQLPTTRQRPSLRGYRRRHARKRHLEMRSRPRHRPRDHPQRTR